MVNNRVLLGRGRRQIPERFRWTGKNTGTVAAADGHNRATAERLDIARSRHRLPYLDHTGQQTCVQTPTILSPPELGNPFTQTHTLTHLCGSMV